MRTVRSEGGAITLRTHDTDIVFGARVVVGTGPVSVDVFSIGLVFCISRRWKKNHLHG